MLTLLFVLSLFFFFGQRFLERDLQIEISLHTEAVDTLFEQILARRAEAMKAAISQLALSEELREAMQRGDRALLLQRAEKHYRPLLEEHGISLFYFHLPDRSVFLRVHRPELFGDVVERSTLVRAATEQRPTSGMELGVLGNFSLRSVVPWTVDGEVIGYIELGREMQTLLVELSESGRSEFIFLLDKEHLDRATWEEWMRNRGHAPKWDALPGQVLIDSTFVPWPDAAQLIHAEMDLARIEIDGRTFQGARLPLHDAGEEVIGTILVLRDVTQRLREFRNSLAMLIGACFALGAALFVSSYITLGRADRSLSESRRRLLDQIARTEGARRELEIENAERRQAEAELESARAELERRVQERTMQLNDSLGAVSRVKDQLQGILGSVQDALVAVDAQGKILQMNHAAEKMFGVTLVGARGRSIEEFAPPAIRERILDALDSRTAGTEFDFEVPPSQEGDGKILQVVTSIIGRNEEDFGGMIFLARDMTRERQIDRIKSEFISTAAHELRTPVTSILGFSELMLQEHDFTPAEQAEFLTIIRDKADALSELIDDLLDVSRIESGRGVELHRSPITVEELITPIIRQYQRVTSSHSIKLSLSAPGVSLEVDKGKIGQVLENLLSNAVKYAPKGGAVHVSGERGEEGEYRISVRDEGIGMSPEEVDRIFEKFFRADSTDSAVSGTGLGMTIVKSIVEAHGGKILVQSARGKGTTVTFTLPMVQAEDLSEEKGPYSS